MSSPDVPAEAPFEPLVRTARPPDLRAGERPLRVFISSVMRGALNPHRQAVVDALDGVPWLSAWAFEFTPPSSDPADETYLRHVREADFVIWLVGLDVTDPVAGEIREALASDRRLIVITLTDDRTSECDALLGEVGARAKYGHAETADEVAKVLSVTMGDEIVRALRGTPGLGRVARIEELGRASQAYCVARWQAAGLTRDTASALANDPAVGRLALELVPDASAPVVLLTGDLGSGKSIASQRYHQQAIEELLADAGAPIPVWMTASQAAASSLEGQVAAACSGLGDPRQQGAWVVIDGVDEVGRGALPELMDQSRILTGTWPKTRALLTTRPIVAASAYEECREVPPLTEEEAVELINRVGGIDYAERLLYTLPASVRGSLGRPLFAILVARWYGGDRVTAPKSVGELLDFLGRESGLSDAAAADETLQRLAVLSVRRELGAVHPAEVGNAEVINRATEHGLLRQRTGGVVFGLPVLAQWYAGRAISSGRVTAAHLAEAPEDLDLWLYPIAMTIQNESFDAVMAILRPLLQSQSGFVFRVLAEAFPRFARDGIAPEWREAGRQIRTALQTIADSLAPLSEIVLPCTGGRIRPLAITTSDSSVQTAYWCGGDQKPAVFALPETFHLLHAGSEWTHVRYAQVGTQASWAWDWARNVLRHDVSGLLKRRSLPFEPRGPLWEEHLWAIAVHLSQKPFMTTDRVEIHPLTAVLEHAVDEAGPDAWMDAGRNHVFRVQEVLQSLRDLADSGEAEMVSPLPVADVKPTGGSAWAGEFYSEDRLVAIAEQFYGRAIDMYVWLVERWFSALKSRLRLYVTLPAVYRGSVYNGRARDRVIPWISEYIEPLAKDARTRVAITQGGFADTPERAEAVMMKTRQLRPEASRWISSSFTNKVFDVARPYGPSNQAYEWLWNDLRAVGVVSGALGFDPR